MVNNQAIISRTIAFVQDTLRGAEGGHNWFHIERVWKNAKRIAAEEAADLLVVELAALLHDIADAKFHNGDEEIGPATARNFLAGEQVDETITEHVVNIIRNISFKGGHAFSDFSSKELLVVRDADRIDAIGAVGIARAFHYGGYKNREIYNPEIPPNLRMTREEYKNGSSPTINHFYEKLLLLKDQMSTKAGRTLAESRHKFMEDFLDQFYTEWDL